MSCLWTPIRIINYVGNKINNKHAKNVTMKKMVSAQHATLISHKSSYAQQRIIKTVFKYKQSTTYHVHGK